MQKEKQLVPKLRFSEFEEEFKDFEIREITKVYDGTHQTPKYVENGVPFYSVEHVSANQFKKTKYISEEVFEKENKRVKLERGDILMTRIGSIGVSKLINWDVRASFYVSLALIKNPISYSSEYINQYISSVPFQKELWKRTIHVAFPIKINLGEINNCKIKFPSLPEQQKIANFLTAIDTQIQTLSTKKSLLEQYKKGVMQKIFKQELRFKDEDGNDFEKWKKLQLIDVAERITTKNKVDNQNVLTISAQLGLVSQLEYFNKSVSAKNLTGYYLLEKNDFAYNKSYSKGYPMGAIKRLDKYDLGVVSTLYICFRFNAKVSLDFMEQYFEAGLQNKEIEKVAQEGARNHGLLNIGVNDFFEIDLKLPSLKEQIKIADFLSAIDKNIALVNTRIEHTKSYKKGLLQQMFV